MLKKIQKIHNIFWDLDKRISHIILPSDRTEIIIGTSGQNFGEDFNWLVVSSELMGEPLDLF
jgi:hypothetical protein